jgi:hypothetical protein
MSPGPTEQFLALSSFSLRSWPSGRDDLQQSLALRSTSALVCARVANAAVRKHSFNVPGYALALEQVFQEAGFPKDSSDWAAAWYRAILRALNTSLPQSSVARCSSTIISAPIRDFH